MKKSARKTVSAARLLPTRYEMVPVKALRPHPRNPRRGDVEAIRQSIRANQFYGALLVQRSSKRILVGEHRWRAAQLEGLRKIPVFWADLDEEAALRILLADNRDNDLAGYDEDLLASALQELSETSQGLGGSGYDDADSRSA